MCQLGIYNLGLNPGHPLTLVLLFLKNDIIVNLNLRIFMANNKSRYN